MPINTSHLAKLLTRGKIALVIEELLTLTRDTSYEEQAILLSAQFYQQKTMIATEEVRRVARTQLIRSANGLLEEIKEDITGELTGRSLSTSVSEPPEEPAQSQPPIVQHITNIYSETYVAGNMTVNQQQIQQHLEPLKQLVEAAAEEEGKYISREEYEELMEILEDMKETQEPSERQQRKWKRWLGKAVETGRKFAGGRLEKGTDSAISNWIKEDGLDKVMEYIGSLAS